IIFKRLGRACGKCSEARFINNYRHKYGMAEAVLQEIRQELRLIRGDLDSLKKHILDEDTILTNEERIAISQADSDFKKGTLRKL
ncbi:MAG: hypothetical protein AAB356_01680, partial [Deltaproteobacteria bacterium]